MKQIIDEKFKDASPEQTVEKIRGILAEKGISVTEMWEENTVCNCYAMRIEVDGNNMGSNGKGVTRALARASGYAELIERLQTGMIGPYCRAVYPDSEMMDRKTMREKSDVLFDCLSALVKKFNDVELTPEQIMEAAYDYAGGVDQVEAVPFYNYTDDNFVYIPKPLLIPLYSATGLAAGNTPEEAMVQGMSEIIERWCQRHLMSGEMVPPTIPEEYLKQYPMAYETITQIRNSGYEVFIKDCSLGMGWPAIAAVVINKKSHAYHVHLGASPVFEIALGRSLTETFQGRKLKEVADTDLSETAKDMVTYGRCFTNGRGVYPISFFTDEPTYPFVPFEDRSGRSNKELLSYCLNFFKERNMKVYVRDYSHWGFTSLKVIIPQICISHFGVLTSELNVPRMHANAKTYMNNLKSATADQLFELHLLNMFRINNQFNDGIPKSRQLMGLIVSEDTKTDVAVGYAHVGYVAWHCGDMATVNTYAGTVARLDAGEISDYFSCLGRMEGMKKDLDEAARRLRYFYDDAVVDKAYDVLKNQKNPFEYYIVDCGKTDENCDRCQYRQTCRRPNNQRLGDLIHTYNMRFDNQAAFQKLRDLFHSLPEVKQE